jgi:hypothetical protein
VTSPRDLIACALMGCTQCNGSGVRLAGCEKIEAVCPCCYRQIARVVLARVRQYSETTGCTIRCDMAQFGRGSNRIGRRENGRKGSELIADAYLIAKRTLSALEFDIYQRHFLHGAPWFQFPAVSRGNFFHACYRIELKLGERFVNLTPYPVFPLDAYMSSDHALNRQADVRPCAVPAPRYPNGIPLVPPMQPAPVVVKVAPSVPPRVQHQLSESGMLAQTVTVDAEGHIRQRLKSGVTLHSIAEGMAPRGFKPPNGVKWQVSDVKRVLMSKRRAA